MAATVALHPKDFNCKNCQWGRHCDETNPHSYDAFKITLYEDIIYEGRVCPKGSIRPFERQMLALHTHYKNGLLPFSGGLLDQPHIFSEAMLIIEQVFAEHGQRTKSRHNHRRYR